MRDRDIRLDAEASRRERAKRISRERIEKTGEGIFRVTGSRGVRYRVDLKAETCSCPDYRRHRKDRIPIRCKHILACLSTEEGEKVDICG